MDELAITPSAEGIRLRIRVKPRASKSRVVGVREGALEVAVAAPPVDGEANAELTAFLAKTLGVSKGAVSLVSGDTARFKTVSVRGVDEATVRSRLSEALA
ncbi:MAG: hypothetical protein AMXMBFR56_51070 [Polyangiaceae bacterium]